MGLVKKSEINTTAGADVEVVRAVDPQAPPVYTPKDRANRRWWMMEAIWGAPAVASLVMTEDELFALVCRLTDKSVAYLDAKLGG